jgi:hypothetical protein
MRRLASPQRPSVQTSRQLTTSLPACVWPVSSLVSGIESAGDELAALLVLARLRGIRIGSYVVEVAADDVEPPVEDVEQSLQ